MKFPKSWKTCAQDTHFSFCALKTELSPVIFVNTLAPMVHVMCSWNPLYLTNVSTVKRFLEPMDCYAQKNNDKWTTIETHYVQHRQQEH